MDALKQVRLRGLSPQDTQLLYYFFENPELTNAQLGKKMSIGDKHVGTLLTSIYKKLDVKGSDNKKKERIYQEYKEDFQILYPDLESLKRVQETSDQPGIFPPAPPRRVNPSVIIIGVLAGFLVISVIVIAVLFNTLRNLNQGEEENPIIDNPTEIAEVPTLQPTVAPTITTKPTQFSTRLPAYVAPTASFTATPKPTKTFTPTATEFIPPADGILFQDNFDSGMNSEWVVRSGKWLISDGKLSLLPHEMFTSYYQWIVLDKPEWRNFIFSVEVSEASSNTYSPFALAVRHSGSQMIGASIDYGADIQMVEIRDSPFDDFPIARDPYYEVNWDTKIEIEVQGDTYILRVDGRQVQNITITGYNITEIGIGSDCSPTDKACPSFDNVEVRYLP